MEGCDKVCCYWFIGLKVELREGNSGGQLDLTTPIKAFTDIVMRSAIQINVWKTGVSMFDILKIPAILLTLSGMKIVADYKKRKELKEYLPHDEHWKLKSEKLDRKSLEKSPSATAAVENPTQVNEERKRSLSVADTDTPSPPTKKLMTGNGECAVIN